MSFIFQSNQSARLGLTPIWYLGEATAREQAATGAKVPAAASMIHLRH
jgi:hypothetical protein